MNPAAIRVVAGQVAVLFAGHFAAMIAAHALGYRGPGNLLWMVGLPLGIALFANRGWARRTIMALVLAGCTLLALFIDMELIGG